MDPWGMNPDQPPICLDGKICELTHFIEAPDL